MKSEKPLIKRLLPFIVVLLALIVAAAIATPTIAYYIRSANEASQDYTPGESTDPSFGTGNEQGSTGPSSGTGNTDPSFQLGGDNKEVKDVSVYVPDDGYPVYVRVAILVTWVRKDNSSVVFDPPVEGEGNSYILDINTTDWEKKEGFYYCKTPIEYGDTNRLTPVLVNSCTLVGKVFQFDETDCFLNVEIIVQTIQAIGSTDENEKPAWEDAWGVK